MTVLNLHTPEWSRKTAWFEQSRKLAVRYNQSSDKDIKKRRERLRRASQSS